MGQFAEILSALKGTRQSVIPTAQPFPVVDWEELARRLKLEAKGTDLGKQERPSSTAPQPDPIEAEIDSEIERRAREALSEYQGQNGIYEARIRQAAITGQHSVAIEAAGSNTLADFSTSVINDRNHLHSARQQVVETTAALREFKTRHRLLRPPSLSGKWQEVGVISGLIVLASIEVILNGTFFAKGSETGLIGGITQALVLSVFNVGGAAAYGFLGLPRLFHRSAAWKAVGIVSTALWVAWTIGINLAIGHFRDLYSLHGDNVTMSMLITEMSHPLLMRDVQSTILSGLGIMLAVVAVVHLAVSRELYPGYAAVGARASAAIRNYSSLKTESLNGLQQLRDNAVRDMSEALRLIAASATDLNRASEGRKALHRNFSAYLDHLAIVRGRLINLYRDANRAARGTQEPAYFAREPLDLSCLQAGTFDPLTEVTITATSAVIGRIELFIKQLNDRYEEAVSRYPTVDDLSNLEVSPLGVA